MLDKKIKAGLSEIVGKASLKQDETVKDYAVDELLPQAVLFPRTVEEVERIAIVAFEEGLSIIPWGGGTQMGLGAPPMRADLVVCLNRLDRILDQDHENMSITAEAGIRLGAIQESLCHVGSGFFLPLDPPRAEEVTLGGAVAANGSGPSQLRYGTLRDLVLGLEVVIPEEREKSQKTSVGGKTVKNVSGYDMSKLYIGSIGTLAIIVEVTCRIIPLPEERATVVAGFPQPEAAWACVQALLETQLIPSAIEVYNREAASLFPAHARLSVKGEAWVAVRLEGIREAVARQIEEINSYTDSEGATEISILRGPEEGDYWKQVGRLGLEVQNMGAWGIGLKASVPISHAPDISKAMGQEGERIDVSCNQLTHAGSGIVYIHIPLPEGLYNEKQEALTRMVMAFREMAKEMGGSLVVEYAPPVFKERIDVWGEVGGVVPIMEALKKEFDPRAVLNPGRYVGGI